MNHKLHADQRKVGRLRQIGPLYDKLVYWLYERQDVRRARPFADKLGQLLTNRDVNIGSIFAEDCQSLVHEAQGNLTKAIKHRLREIRLIRRLHRLSQNTAQADFVFRQYSYTDLRDELDSLAILYHDSGNLSGAISTLQASKQLCRDHGLKFDAAALLNDYLKERPSITGGYVKQRPSITLHLMVSENGTFSVEHARPDPWEMASTAKSGSMGKSAAEASRQQLLQSTGTTLPLHGRQSTVAPLLSPRLQGLERDPQWHARIPLSIQNNVGPIQSLRFEPQVNFDATIEPSDRGLEVHPLLSKDDPSPGRGPQHEPQNLFAFKSAH